jgi:aminoglycoside phosphotransferase family enzyme
MQNTQLPDFVSFLLQPIAYSSAPGNVKLVQTHISYVFITDDFVYKFKKPVDFGFLDFTTLAKRRHFCEQELLLNRRLCPSIYLDLVALEKTGNSFRLKDKMQADPERIVEYGVKMKRMPEERMMANVIRSGQLTGEMIDSICDVLVPFYAQAEGGTAIKDFGRPEAVGVNIFENFTQTETFVGTPSLGKEQFNHIKGFSTAFLQQDGLFAARIDAGRIRDCHGDLYSANICLADKVYIFDCIEFNKRFRYCDVASDIAFLAMDLDYHGLADMSERFVARFSKKSGDAGLGTMLNFYKCYRAYVRGKINLFTASAPEVDKETKLQCQEMAGKYFQLAERYAAQST